MAEEEVAAAILHDTITETFHGFSFPCEVRATATGPELYGEAVRVWLDFKVEEHISHILLTFGEVKRKYEHSQAEIHHVAKLRIPALALGAFELVQTTPKVLGDQETWDGIKAIDAEANPKPGQKFFILTMRVNLARCAIEGLRVKSTAANQNMLNLRVHLGGADGTGNTLPQPLTDVDLHIVLRGSGKVIRDFDRFNEIVRLDNITDPLKKWYPKTRRYQLQIGQSLAYDEHPFYVLDKVYGFFPDAGCGMNDYLTRMGFGLMQDHEFVFNKLNPMEWRKAEIVLVQSAGLGERAFFGIIAQDDMDRTARYQPGDIVEINFEPEELDIRKSWRATVQEPLPYTTFGDVTVLVSRPWDKERGEYKDLTQNYPFLKLEELGETSKTIAAIEDATTIPIAFRSQVSEKVFRMSISAMEEMFKTYQLYVTKTGTAFAPSAAQLNDKAVLLNNAPDLLPEVDFYASVKQFYESCRFPVELGMNLNDEQMEVIECCQRAPGGWVLVQGPPGTGKTHLAIETILPFLLADTNEQVLLASATNAGVDALACKADLLIQKWKYYGCVEGKFVIRVHSADTEGVISMHEGKKHRPIPENARPKVYDESLNEKDTKAIDEIEAARVMHQRYLHSVKQKFPGIRDPRVQELELSIGFRMLQVMGFANTDIELMPDRLDSNNEDKYETVTEAYQQYINNEEFNVDRMKLFRELLKGLREDILNQAAIVVTTISTAGSFYIYEKARPTIIIVDEAARALETDILALSIRYPLAVGKMLVGDISQLRPVVRSLAIPKTDPGHNFSKQLSISTMHRLQQSDFKVIMLKTQFRAIPEIMAPYSKIVYDDELLNGKGTARVDRPLAGQISKFNADQFSKGAPVVFFDIQNAKAEATETQSQFNRMFCAFAVNLIVGLLQQDFVKAGRPTIGVLMPYQAQYLGYTAAQGKMMIKGIEGIELVTFDKIDRQQGNEWDIVIVDLTITSNIGFLRERNRLNVLFSRARTALYIIGNKTAMDKIVDRNARWVQEFYNEYLRFRVPVDDAEITSEYVDFDTINVEEQGGEAGWEAQEDVQDEQADAPVEQAYAQDPPVEQPDAPVEQANAQDPPVEQPDAPVEQANAQVEATEWNTQAEATEWTQQATGVDPTGGW